MNQLSPLLLLLTSCLSLGCASNPHLDILVDTNKKVAADQPRDCAEHTELTMVHMVNNAQYFAQPLYSCPDTQQALNRVCHVSTLVVAPDNSRWVLDNGAVLGSRSIAVSGVSDFASFVWALGDKPYWTGPLAKTEMSLYIAQISAQH